MDMGHDCVLYMCLLSSCGGINAIDEFHDCFSIVLCTVNENVFYFPVHTPGLQICGSRPNVGDTFNLIFQAYFLYSLRICVLVSPSWTMSS
jgi:hypothetical protein